MKKSKLILLLATLFCLVVSVTAHAQDVVSDYFYPAGRSSYYVYTEGNNTPTERVNVTFSPAGQGLSLEEEPPIPLVGGIIYRNAPVTNCYTLNITDTTVTANAWWTKTAGDNANTRNNLRYSVVLLKLPAGKELINWTTTIYEGNAVAQVWEMTAKRMLMPVKKNGVWVAVPSIEVRRSVFDAQHNPVPGQSVIEYWQKDNGKAKVVRAK